MSPVPDRRYRDMAPGESLDQQQLGLLYSAHHGWLQGWLRKKLGCSEHAADLAQDTFLRLLASRRPLPALQEPRAYLTTVARGLLIDHFRREDIRLAYQQALAAMPEPLHPSPEERLLLLETLIRIDMMLDTLPPQTRQIFLLSQLHEKTYAEIATRMDVSLITVKRHMQKAFLACLTLL